MTCPQCKQEVDAIQHLTYAVGWCGYDVHTACTPLHVRSCRVCYPHNTGFILQDQHDQHRKQAS